MIKLTKKMLNSNIHLSEGNFKLEGTKEIVFMIFNLPSKRSCPFATKYCKGDDYNKGKCFAQYAEYLYENVRKSRNNNFEETKKDTFTDDMINHLQYNLGRKKNENKTIYIRIHESGDFWSKEYFNKWILISNYFKNNSRIKFQAYTKSLPYLENKDLSKINIKLLYSVMPDTQKEDIIKAKNIGLTLFELVPLGETKTDALNCGGNCHKCMACYKENDIKKIYVDFHGPNVKSHKSQDTGVIHQFEKINEYRKKLRQEKNID